MVESVILEKEVTLQLTHRSGDRHISLLVVAMAMHVHEFWGGGGASEGVYLFGCLVEISTIFLQNDSTFK